MRILHIIRSEPEEMVQQLIRSSSEAEDCAEIRLYQGNVDYDQLVAKIFDSDVVRCWW